MKLFENYLKLNYLKFFENYLKLNSDTNGNYFYIAMDIVSFIGLNIEGLNFKLGNKTFCKNQQAATDVFNIISGFCWANHCRNRHDSNINETFHKNRGDFFSRLSCQGYSSHHYAFLNLYYDVVKLAHKTYILFMGKGITFKITKIEKQNEERNSSFWDLPTS